MAPAMVGVGRAIRERLAESPGRPFLECGEDRFTRSEFLAAVQRRAEALRRAGAAAGDRVLIPSGRGAAFFVDMMAAWWLGAVAVPISQDVGEERAADIVAKARPTLLTEMTAPPLAALAELARPGAEPEPGASLPEAAAPPASAPAAILFTSGSTGRPKGAVLSGRSLEGNSRGILSVLDLREEDRLFIAIAFHFTSAINHFIACGLTGATLVAVEDKLLKADLHRAIRETRATCFGGAPIQARWLAECCRTEALPSLRWVMTSGDALPVEVIEQWQAVQPATGIYTVYGLTELGGRYCILPAEALPRHAGAVGQPMPGLTATIRDETGAALPDGEVGEIYADGDFLLDEYVNDPDATAASLGPLGFRTGDLGYIDPAGYLRLVGRADDVFKVSGQKVSAVNVADVLAATGLFDDVAVVPRPHPVMGATPFCFYTLRPGAAFDQPTVMRALRASLPATHMVRGFQEVDRIPRTGSGKLERATLRRMLGELERQEASA